MIQFATDLTGRIDFVKFGREPQASVEHLIELGCNALDISLSTAPQVVEGAQGSFYLAQRLCHDTCLLAGVTEKDAQHRDVSVSHELVVEKTMENLDRTYFDVARKFAIGSRLRREGRAPYLHMLNWLGTSETWAIALEEEMNLHPEEKASVGQVVSKDYLADLLEGEDKDDFARVLHFDTTTKVLSAEDPQFVFYLRNVGWQRFAKRVGFLRTQFVGRYDVALSFAGTDRPVAEQLFSLLSEEQELAVFYDKNEQHRILAEDIEEYLAPIYRSEAGFVVPLLGPTYPERVWTRFESKQFEDRFGENSVIPIMFKNAPAGSFDKVRNTGGITFDAEGNVEEQLREIARLIAKKVAAVSFG